MFICFAATSGGISFEQVPVTEIHIQSICGEVGADWATLGFALELPSALLYLIEIEYSTYREKTWEMLQEWKRGSIERRPLTVGILIDALENIGRKDVVEKLLGM